MKQKLIVLSADALTFEDMEYLKTLPNYRKYLEGGCRVKRVRSVYPTITYPCHTTMVTGVWPEKHGVLSNMELIPGASPVPWKWFYSSVSWKEDLFTAAKRAGLTTAAIFWPVTGGHPAIDYLIDEYWPQPGDENMRHVFARAGSSEEVLDIIEEQLHGIRIRTHPQTDDFIMRCAREFILRYQPDLLMLHPANIDAYRHNYGLFNDQVTKGVEETDRYIGELMEAVEEAGLSDCTNLALVSDHGQIDIKRIVSPNVLLAEAGLIETDGFTSFGESLKRPLVSSFRFEDYRYGKATHGHLPDKGPQPVFSAKGPAFRTDVVLERADLVDEAPTFARALGIELKDADGRVLKEFMSGGERQN